jgi:transcriptional regulator with XRE-family HTH domain
MPSGPARPEIQVLLGKAIRLRRQRLGFSQEQLGFRSDLHRTYVADVERGARNLSLGSLVKLSLALNLRVSALLKTAESLTDGRGRFR